ncbi:MAG: aminomethyl-transferring glycine dehydrogenase [Acidimicrobiales bacterium]
MTDRPTLGELDRAERFVDRHIGASPDDVAKMLATVGFGSLDDLTAAAVPGSIAATTPLDLPTAASEAEAIAELRDLADRNRPLVSMLGLGYFGTITPPVILRNVLEDPGWYTAYTPYQPEISQGRLEALLNFQTMVEDLTGLPVANSSLLDEATAAAEAMALCHRMANGDGVFLVDADALPQTIAVVSTRAEAIGVPVAVVDLAAADVAWPDGEIAGVLVQYPGTSGVVRDWQPVIEAAHERGALAVVATDLLALTRLKPPGELGADVAVGSAQRFGVPLGFGGPHAGFMAVRDGLRRSLPGRLVGVSVDADGHPAHRLALQTREQHIRREKATSNICTAQVLLAVVASMYAVYHGPGGLAAIATRAHRYAAVLAAALGRHDGVEVVHDAFFDTLTARVPGRAAAVAAAALERGINVRLVDDDTVAVACDETTRRDHVEAVLQAFGAPDVDLDLVDRETGDAIPDGLRRESPFLTHPVFNSHRSETAMLRYLRHLSDKDIALDRSMIPLGSCTMKLNATTEMEPVTWPGFTDIHPFAPVDQADGYLALIRQLEAWLAEITGYAAVSLQPNAGSQGEFAGLLAIRAWHRSRGETNRTVCLIPSSAHGTNAASAAMCGMRVVVVACDGEGNVDLDDLRAKVDEHGDDLAALMVTYPSTHGVFEEAIAEICDVVHRAGGQVYVDGANLNALVGLARFGSFGADVSHLNLHKTFCIPHGGGGPGVGPVAVAAHLAPFLPNHPLLAGAGPDTGVGPISAAPFGSALVLPISWAYVRMMGAAGLRRATQVAILSANYIARRLGPHYPVLYTGRHDLVAHECIIDLRPIQKESGVTNEDVAKRLIDYGFHAPTMSFPVAGTLMIEPTESEDLAEIDRFCDAMIAIRAEIGRVASGDWPADDNPLGNAPHTAEMLAGPFAHAYTREEAAYPVASLRNGKYWPPVRRIDNGYGDRHLVCACPPVESYAT